MKRSEGNAISLVWLQRDAQEKAKKLTMYKPGDFAPTLGTCNRGSKIRRRAPASEQNLGPGPVWSTGIANAARGALLPLPRVPSACLFPPVCSPQCSSALVSGSMLTVPKAGLG